MSLQSVVYKINNNLISLFALLDGWCDREHAFLHGKHRTHLSPYETLQQLVKLNAYALCLVNESALSVEDKRTEIDYLFLKASEISTPDFLRAVDSRIWFDGDLAKDPTMDEVRDLLREQLFNFLCALDRLHSERLDIINAESNVYGLREIEMINILTQEMLDFVKKYDEKARLEFRF
jgi:hypothetical protein